MSETENPIESLREAAALMRDNASKAEPGRWKTWGMSVLADPKGNSDYDDAIPVADAFTPSTSARRLHTGNVDHIASWHPAVAERIANLFDVIAADVGTSSLAHKAAVDVATAYLGRP